MKKIKSVSFSVLGSAIGLIAMSACVQPESSATTSKSRLLSQSAGPLTISSDQTAKKDTKTLDSSPTDGSFCKTPEGNENMDQIGEGAEALFQILKTDASDLTTIHDRASHLADLENAFSANFLADCSASGLTAENTADRITNLTQLSTETDATIIHTLAQSTWDLFNSNINISTDGTKSSPNPFADPATN